MRQLIKTSGERGLHGRYMFRKEKSAVEGDLKESGSGIKTEYRQ